jgi:hypothetical protein
LKGVIRATVDESLIQITHSPIESSDFVPDTPNQSARDVPQAASQNEKSFDEQNARLDGSKQSWLRTFQFMSLVR